MYIVVCWKETFPLRLFYYVINVAQGVSLFSVVIAYHEYHVIAKFTDLVQLFNCHSVYIFLVLPIRRRVCPRRLLARERLRAHCK